MLDQYLPKEHVRRRNEQELYVQFTNGSILKILGADKPDSLRGIDACGVVFDEFSLMKREVWEEIFRPIITQSANRWAMFLFTPKGINHAHEYWKNAEHWSGWSRSMLKASESGLMPEKELLQARIEMSDALYEQELECSFVAREERSLITSEMLEDLIGLMLNEDTKRLIAVDPATGGDECVALVFEGTKVIDALILHEDSTMVITGELMALGVKYGTHNFAVDSIGIGKGIVDRLSEQGQTVISINSAEKAHDNTRFYNKRIEMWWEVSQAIRQHQVQEIHDEETKRQLVAPKYEIVDSNGKMRLEPKKYTKEILGRSPDRADAYVYGIYARQFVIDDRYDSPRKVYAPQKLRYHSYQLARR